MAIRLDFTSLSVVIVCDKCPHWRALRYDRVSAWAAAKDHEADAHEGERQASLAWGLARRAELRKHVDAQAAKLSPYIETE